MANHYIVYLNKSHDVWAQDAHTWAQKNNIPIEEEPNGSDNIISEVIFRWMIDKGTIGTKPVYFCKDIQSDRVPFQLNSYNV
jgi:hypothetical protein